MAAKQVAVDKAVAVAVVKPVAVVDKAVAAAVAKLVAVADKAVAAAKVVEAVDQEAVALANK